MIKAQHVFPLCAAVLLSACQAASLASRCSATHGAAGPLGTRPQARPSTVGHAMPAPLSPSVDRESTREKLERLVEIPGQERTDVEWLMTMRAHQTLRALGKPGFDEFVACVDDARPVWPELSLRRRGPTSLGETCLMLITEHVDALYLDEGGLDFVTAQNAREWWRTRREVPLADLQIEALVAFRDREADRAEGSPPEVRAYIENRILNDLETRIARARQQREFGLRLTIRHSSR
jgi:hypothetical protein